MTSTSQLDFVALYASHAAFVRRLLVRRGVRPADLDDVLQDTFITIHRLLPTFEHRSSIETWLYSITWRIVAHYHRSRRERHSSSDGLRDLCENSAPMVGVGFDRVHASFAGIDDEYRDLLALHEIGGLSISCLAELTGNARKTIRTRLERGRNAVVRALGGSSVPEHQDSWFEQMGKRFQDRPEARSPEMLVLPCRTACISTLDDMVLAVWRGPTTEDALHLLIEVMIAHMQTWPNGIRYLNVMERTSTPPSCEGRALMVWLAKEIGPSMKAAANIVEGSALMALTASVINSCLFLARSSMNTRFCSDLATGVPWIAQYGETSIEETLAHVQCMRRHLESYELPTSRLSLSASKECSG